MQRAAVVIGVKQTGHLPVMPAAHSAARNMAQSALTQNISPNRVITILDDTQPVSVRRIRVAIKLLADTLVVEQLLIYFCGHGIYSRSWPAAVTGKWFNARDPRDVVALFPLTPGHFPPQPISDKSTVHNRPDDPHNVEDYLSDHDVARCIQDALFQPPGERSSVAQQPLPASMSLSNRHEA